MAPTLRELDAEANKMMRETIGYPPDLSALSNFVTTVDSKGEIYEKEVPFRFSLIPEEKGFPTSILYQLILEAGGTIVTRGNDDYSVKVLNDLWFLLRPNENPVLPPDVYSSRFIYDAVRRAQFGLPSPDPSDHLVSPSKYAPYDLFKVLKRERKWSELDTNERTDDDEEVVVRAQEVVGISLDQFKSSNYESLRDSFRFSPHSKSSAKITEEQVSPHVEISGEISEVTSEEEVFVDSLSSPAKTEVLEVLHCINPGKAVHTKPQTESSPKRACMDPALNEVIPSDPDHAMKDGSSKPSESRVIEDDAGSSKDDGRRKLAKPVLQPSPKKTDIIVRSPKRPQSPVKMVLRGVAGPSNRDYTKKKANPNPAAHGWHDGDKSDMEDVTFSSGDCSDTDDGASSTSSSRSTRSRRAGIKFSITEDQLIIDKIIEKKAFLFTSGQNLYKAMAESKDFRWRRSWSSLHERWRKAIKPALLDKSKRRQYKISSEDLEQLLKGLQEAKLKSHANFAPDFRFK